MAEEAEAAGGEVEGGVPKKKLNPQMLLVLGNTVFLLVALGVLAYTKLLYQKPPIVENVEMKKVVAEAKAPAEPAQSILVPFDKVTVDIAMTMGKAHYATMTFALQCRDEQTAQVVQDRKAVILDRLLTALDKRELTELNTIQGKLLLKTDLMHKFNDALKMPGAITDIFFSNFVLE